MELEPYILFAEDDPDTRQITVLLLKQHGFRVCVAKDASDLLNLAALKSFDILLLDNWMPELTGVELCGRIREFDQTTPILFCSGVVTKTEIEAAYAAGAQGYIEKPFDSDDLIRTIRSLTNRSTSKVAGS